jgi:hypothetical protein
VSNLRHLSAGRISSTTMSACNSSWYPHRYPIQSRGRPARASVIVSSSPRSSGRRSGRGDPSKSPHDVWNQCGPVPLQPNASCSTWCRWSSVIALGTSSRRHTGGAAPRRLTVRTCVPPTAVPDSAGGSSPGVCPVPTACRFPWRGDSSVPCPATRRSPPRACPVFRPSNLPGPWTSTGRRPAAYRPLDAVARKIALR